MKGFGKELILDLHKCDVKKFTRYHIKKYFVELCVLIDMQREDLHWWDYKGLPEEYAKAPAHLKGVSAIQFIKTSNITIHTLDVLKKVYINIFSCKEFDPLDTTLFTAAFFGGKVVNKKFIERK